MTLWKLKNMYVYFVKAGKRGAIKIGTAINIERRIKTMQTGNHLKLKLVASIKCNSRKHAREVEKRLHKLFKKQRIRGEWYKSSIRLSNLSETIEYVETNEEAQEIEIMNKAIEYI